MEEELEDQWIGRRLRTANSHTEEAFTKLQSAVKEIDILRRQLQRAQISQERDQKTIGKLCVKLDKARSERDEARFWAWKFQEKTLS